jgi:hypothetical protein
MPIRLECPNPNCKVKLTVKEHLAGKRVPCPKCKQPLLIPAPVDVEALAAAALGDEPKAEQAAASTIDFTCPFCDEAVHLPRELGGKKAPCPNPECRRIIKVPMPKDERPDDWRTLKRTGPSGARENVEAPRLEGAWDTSRSTVSGEALVEAGAIEEEKEPVTTAQQVRRIAIAATAVVVLLVAVAGVRWYLASSQQQSLLEQALSYAANGKLAPERKGALERLAGEYFLDAKQEDKARSEFAKARNFFAASPTAERDAGLRELAMAQTRLSGAEVVKDIQQTLHAMQDDEAKLIALRDVSGKLLADNRGAVALQLSIQIGTVAPPPADGGSKRNPDDEPDDGVPKAAPPQVEKKPDPSAGPSTPLASQRIAVGLAMNQVQQAAQVRPRPSDAQKAPDALARQGYAEGAARQDKYNEAVDLARLPGEPLDRLRTWLALAEIAAESGKNEQAKRYAHEALTVFESELKKAKISPWHAWQLASVLARSGGEAKAKEVADAITDPVLKGRAQLEIFLLKATPSELDSSVSDHTTLAYALGLEAVTRNNARAGATGEEQRELSEEVRPFVLLGAALGMQDTKR